jgi:hypothetical protein
VLNLLPDDDGNVFRKQMMYHTNFQKNNAGRKSFFTPEHETYIRNLLDEDPQLYTEEIIDKVFI